MIPNLEDILILILFVLILATLFMLLLPKKKYRAWSYYENQSQKIRLEKKVSNTEVSNKWFKNVRLDVFIDEAAKAGWDVGALAPVYLYGGAVAGVGIGVLFGTWIGGVIAILGGLWLPWYLVGSKLNAKQEREEEQVEILAASIAAYFAIDKNLPYAMEKAGGDLQGAFREQWERLVVEYKSGRSLRDLLADLNTQLSIREFEILSTILLIVEENGGDATETIKQVAVTIQDKRIQEEELKAELLQSRSSYRSNLVVAGAMVFVFRFLQPDQFKLLMDSLIGQILLSAVFLYIMWSVRAVRKLTTLRGTDM